MFPLITSRQRLNVSRARLLGQTFRGESLCQLHSGCVTQTKPTQGPSSPSWSSLLVSTGPSASLGANGPESCLDVDCSFFCF